MSKDVLAEEDRLRNFIYDAVRVPSEMVINVHSGRLAGASYLMAQDTANRMADTIR